MIQDKVCTRAISEFYSLYFLASKSLREVCQKERKSWLKNRELIVNIYDRIVYLIVLSLFIIIVYPAVWTWLNDLSLFPAISGLVLAASIVALWFLLPFLLQQYLIKKFQGLTQYFVIFFALIILPMFLALTQYVLSFWLGEADARGAGEFLVTFLRNSVQITFALNQLSLVVLFALGFVLYVSSPLLLIAVSTFLMPEVSKDAFSHKVYTSTVEQSLDYTEHWDDSLTQQVALLAERRKAYLDIRSQILFPTLGLLGLLSVLAVFLSVEQIQTFLDSLTNLLSALREGPAVAVEIIFGISIAFIITMGIAFFARIYWLSNVLEVVETVCDAKSQQLKAQEMQSKMKDAVELENRREPRGLFERLLSAIRRP